MDRRTVDVYEQNADDWVAHRKRPLPDSLVEFAGRVPPGEPRLDLGCGPGWHTAALGTPAVALDAAKAMLDLVPANAPGSLCVQADLEALPFRAAALGGTWAHKCYMHVPAERVPLALADLHRSMSVGAALHVQVTSDRNQENADDRFPGRHFSWWPVERFRDVIVGAGFEPISVVDDGEEWIDVEATRARTLADTVGPGMRLLVVGLNPSVFSADIGTPFARKTNRFWPAAFDAGVVSDTFDSQHALRVDGVGMTDLVKRATASAKEVSLAEFREGSKRVERLVAWLRPGAVCFLGITDYRRIVDRRAAAGWQSQSFGGQPTYVMPNPSGINTHVRIGELAEHLREAATPRR